LEAERAERARQKEEEKAKDRHNFEWLQQLRREGFRKVRGEVHRELTSRQPALMPRPQAIMHLL
jgi:hypothetical protein